MINTSPPLSRTEYLRIIRMRVYSFLREFCAFQGDALANVIRAIAQRNEASLFEKDSVSLCRGVATVADLLEAPDRPLLFEDNVERILGCASSTPAVIDRVFGRLHELGIAPDPLGFSTLPIRARHALIRSGIGKGAPMRTDVEEYYSKSGLEGLRLAMLHKGAVSPHFDIAEWLGHPVDVSLRAELGAKHVRLHTQLAAAEEKLAALRVGVRVSKHGHLPNR